MGSGAGGKRNDTPIPISLDEFLRELWPTLWHTLVDGIHINDEAGRFLFVNPAYCDLVGYEAEDLIGRSFLSVVPSGLRERYVEQYRDAASSDIRGLTGEFQLQHRDGHRLHVHVRASALETDGQRLNAFITRDITRQRSLEQRLMHHDRIRALGTLAGGVAHEFNNLLVSILGYAEMIASLDPGDKAASFAHKIQRAARRGTRITGQLLPFARKYEFRREPVDLHEVLREAVDLFRLSDASGGIAVALAERAQRSWIHANATQLHQVFLNLLINARDAMPDGGDVQIETVDLADDGPGGTRHVEVRIADTGCGMDEEIRRRVFEPFFTTKRSGKGTGLGMALVFSTVTSHGGSVDVESTPLVGSTVRVRFPCIEGA